MHDPSANFANKVIGSVNTMLALIYGDIYTKSSAQKNVSSIVFAGTVVGQLFFGYLSDTWSGTDSLPVPPWYWDWRRVPGWQCGLCREYGRTQVWPSEQVVHLLYRFQYALFRQPQLVTFADSRRSH